MQLTSGQKEKFERFSVNSNPACIWFKTSHRKIKIFLRVRDWVRSNFSSKRGKGEPRNTEDRRLECIRSSPFSVSNAREVCLFQRLWVPGVNYDFHRPKNRPKRIWSIKMKIGNIYKFLDNPSITYAHDWTKLFLKNTTVFTVNPGRSVVHTSYSLSSPAYFSNSS